MFPVMKLVIGRQNRVMPTNDKYTNSLCENDKLIVAVKGEWGFQLPITYVQLKGKSLMAKKLNTANDVKLLMIVSDQGAFENAFSHDPNTRVPV